MIALIGNFDVMELLVIGSVALLVFGKRLPEVAVRGAAQLVRLRRSVTRMWREAGLEEELRRIMAVTAEDIRELIAAMPFHPRTIVRLGPGSQ